MADDRAATARPRLRRAEALQAFRWGLTNPAPASGGPLGFWMSSGTDIAVPGEPAGSVAARVTSHAAIAWNSLGEYDQARSAAGESLARYRISLLARALGGYRIRRPEQAGQDGDRVTYRFQIAVRLHGDSGPLPWLGPVTDRQVRGPDNGIPPCFARVLHGDLTVDLGQIPDAVAALELPRDRQLEVFGPEPGVRDRPADTMAAVLSDSMAHGEQGVPFPFLMAGQLTWGDPVPWLPDNAINPQPPEADVLGDADDIALAEQITASNRRLIAARRSGRRAYQHALADAGPWTREVLLLDEVPGLVATRMQLPAGRPRRPGRPAARAGRASRSLHELRVLSQQARRIASADTGEIADRTEPGRIAGELARLRAAAARNEALRVDAGRRLAECYAAHAVHDLGAHVHATPVWHRGVRCCYDVEIEVPFEDGDGERVMWQRPGTLPGDPCARVLIVRSLFVDLGALTAEQVCAAYPLGYDFFGDIPGVQALDASVADLGRPGSRPGLFAGGEPPAWTGYRRRARGGVPRLLRVIAGDGQVGQASDASREPAPGSSPDFPGPGGLSRPRMRSDAGRPAAADGSRPRPRRS